MTTNTKPMSPVDLSSNAPSESAMADYRSNLASQCQGLARCFTYNDKPLEAKAKHLLLEASHALDSASIRVHRKRDGRLIIINARGKSRFMTLRERIAYWLLKQSTEIQP